MPFTIITGDTFVSDGAGQKINMPSSADYVEVFNMTNLAAANPNEVTISRWYGPKFGAGASPAGGGVKTVKTTSDLTSTYSSGGFTYVTTSPVVEAQSSSAITAITAANPAVVSQVNTYSEDDFLILYNTTGMKQIAGMVFQISSVSGAGYSLLGLNASGFAAPATAGYTRRISKNLAVNPQYLYVTAISKAVQAVVTLSVDPSPYYVVGNKVHFNVPSSFGMSEMDQQTGVIVDVDASTYQITVDIDSSAFTTFAFPASSSSPTARLFATISPAGSATTYNPNTGVQTGYEFIKTPFHTGQFVPYLYLAGGSNSPGGAANDQINWIAYKFEN